MRTWEIAERLGISPRRVQQMIAAGEFGDVGRTPGGYALVRESVVEAVKNASKAKSAQSA